MYRRQRIEMCTDPIIEPSSPINHRPRPTKRAPENSHQADFGLILTSSGLSAFTVIVMDRAGMDTRRTRDCHPMLL